MNKHIRLNYNIEYKNKPNFDFTHNSVSGLITLRDWFMYGLLSEKDYLAWRMKFIRGGK